MPQSGETASSFDVPAFLLGTQALVDSARNDDTTPVHRWAATEAPDEDDVVTSVVSFTLFKHHVDALDSTTRPPWQRLFSAALARFRACDGILPISLDAALRAAELRAMRLDTVVVGQTEPLGDLGRLVAATALEEHLVLVDKRQPYHAELESAHGLAFLDPYAR